MLSSVRNHALCTVRMAINDRQFAAMHTNEHARDGLLPGAPMRRGGLSV